MENACIVKLVTATHKPFDTRIFHKEAMTLSNAGYKVKIIIPSLKIIDHDHIAFVTVSNPKTGFQQLFKTPYLIFKRALKENKKTSVFHVHDSQLLFISFLLKLMGRKVIYDAHEDTPLQLHYQHWIPKVIKPFYILYYKILENICGKLFDHIIVAEPVIAKYFPSAKTTLIRNFPLVNGFRTYTDSKPYQEREKQIVYVGLISKARGIHTMIDAVLKASKETELTFALGGSFSPKELENEITNHSNIVKYLAWLSLDEVIKVMFNSQMGIIIPEPNERYKSNYPVKMFEYMAAGLPVIASDKGISSKFINECDGGILVDPENAQKVSEAILNIFANPEASEKMGLRGQKLVFEKYNWEEESKKLLDCYEKIFQNSFS